MKTIFEEYGEALLAIGASIGVIGVGLSLLWTNVSEQVLYIAKGM